MFRFDSNPPAIVQQVEETEQQLIDRLRDTLSVTAWEIGAAASKWTKLWARGRGDEDFGKLVGLSRDQVSKRRLIFDQFGGCALRHKLSWTHFYVALRWKDAEQYLQWAADVGASVAEMESYRRVSRGENIDSPATQAQTEAPQQHDDGAAPDVSQDRSPAPAEPEHSEDVREECAVAESGNVTSAPPTGSTAPAKGNVSATPFRVSDAILKIRELLRRAETETDLEGREELADELRSWANRLFPSPQMRQLDLQPGIAEMQVVVNEWNMLGPPFPRCARLTNNRKRHLRARLADPDWSESWRVALEKMQQSSFCRGETKDGDWVADFDWFIRPDSVLKLMEGKYQGGTGAKSAKPSLVEMNRAAFDEVFREDDDDDDDPF